MFTRSSNSILFFLQRAFYSVFSCPADYFADKLTFLSSNRTLREVNKIWETTLPCLYFSQITMMLNELLLIIHGSRIWFTFSQLLEKEKGFSFWASSCRTEEFLPGCSQMLFQNWKNPPHLLPFSLWLPEDNSSLPCASSPNAGGDTGAGNYCVSSHCKKQKKGSFSPPDGQIYLTLVSPVTTEISRSEALGGRQRSCADSGIVRGQTR